MKKILADIGRNRTTGVVITVVAALWLLTACSADDAAEQDGQEELKLEAWATRAGGDNGGNYGDIMAFLSSTDGINAQGIFKYSPENDSHYWRAQNLKVKPGTRTFYLYGFMPAETEMNGSMDRSTNLLTINNLAPLSEKDICVVTGVALSKNILTAEEMVNQHRGKYVFKYKNTDYQETTYLNLRLEPIFGRLEFKFKTGPEYYKLRRIKLTNIEIDAKAKEKLSAAVTLPSGVYDDVSVAYSSSGEEKDRKELLWPDPDETNGTLDGTLTDEPTGPYGGINVAVGMGVNCELICTYEVYDRKGNKLSERKATNSLSKVMPEKGQKRTVTLTVEPTYLYQLSEQDLDNPKMTIE